MADETKPLLLADELSLSDCVALGQLMNMPGFEVLVRLNEAACQWATSETLKLDPEKPDYTHRLGVRTQRARNFNEAIQYVRLSALTHVDRVKKQREQEEAEAEDAVANTLGIHPATPTNDSNAIVKTFGIHPAKPKKAAK